MTRSVWSADDGSINEWADTTGVDPISVEYYGGVDTIAYKSNYCEELDGFFIAPAAGDYKFYSSCDDSVSIYLNKGATAFDETQIVAGT